MYSLYIYSPALDPLGIVESVGSLQWLSLYQDAGEAKLVCPADDTNMALLCEGNYLFCTEQKELARICETDVRDTGKEAALTVRAVFSVARWGDRVVMATENITNAEAAMLALTSKYRKGLIGINATAKDYTDTAPMQISWGSVLDALATVAKVSTIGFCESFDRTIPQLIFETYKGVERTNGVEYNGYLGDDIDNLSNISIKRSATEYKNVAIVAGQGEGAARVVETVRNVAADAEDIRELFVDAKDISPEYQVATPTGAVDKDGNPVYSYETKTYSDAEYRALLRERGTIKLAEHIKKIEVSADVGQELMLFGRDYALGDILPIKLVRYGIYASARITAAKTVYEGSGIVVTVTLDNFTLKEDFNQ